MSNRRTSRPERSNGQNRRYRISDYMDLCCFEVQIVVVAVVMVIIETVIVVIPRKPAV